MPGSFVLNGATPSSPGQVETARAVVPTTSATLPEVEPRLIEPFASAAGKGVPFDVPPDSRTRKYLPGVMAPVVKLLLLVPKFEPTPAYCTEYGVTEKSTIVVPRLNISTKSFW